MFFWQKTLVSLMILKNKNMKKYNLPQAFLLSLFSRELYRDVCKNWQGIGFIYILILLSVVLLPAAINIFSSIHTALGAIKDENGDLYLSDKMKDIASQVPDMFIEEGRLNIKTEGTYIIKNPDTGSPLVIIDTTGKTLSLKDSPASVLATENFIIIKEHNDHAQRMVWKDLLDLFKISHSEKVIINSKIALGWMEKAIEQSYLIPYIFYFWKLPSLFILFSLRALIFAFGGTIICQMLKTELPFSTLIRLAAVASTPIILLEAISVYTGQEIFGFKDFVYFVAHCWFMYFAIESNKKNLPDGL